MYVVILKIEALKSIPFHKMVQRLHSLNTKYAKSTEITVESSQVFSGWVLFFLFLFFCIFQMAYKYPTFL